VLPKLFKVEFSIIPMLKRKRLRTKGKFSFTKYFQKFVSGDSVAIVRELNQQGAGFPKKMQGRTGKVVEKRGSAYVVEVKDYNKLKTFAVMPVHLKKIETK